MSAEEGGCALCSVEFIAGVLAVLALVHFLKLGFYIKLVYFGLCIMVGGTLGFIASIPYGRTADNHFRIFKVFRFFTSVLGLKVTVTNADRLVSDKAFIIIANHQSCIDVLGMGYVWPQNCVVMLKNTLKYAPGFNLCAYICHSIYINRFSKEKAHKTVDTTLHDVVTYNRKVWIYPEGTRNAEPQLLPFKKGAFILAKEAKIPIVACAFSSHKQFYDYAERRFDFGGKLLVDVLPPIDTAKFETVDDLAKHCQQLIQERREQLDKLL